MQEVNKRGVETRIGEYEYRSLCLDSFFMRNDVSEVKKFKSWNYMNIEAMVFGLNLTYKGWEIILNKTQVDAEHKQFASHVELMK